MKKKVLIQLTVPSFVVAAHASTKYAWRSLQWIFKPPRCEGCGARMHAKHYHFEHYHKENNTRLLVENHGKRLCPTCVKNEVLSSVPKAASSVLFDHEPQDHCDVCQAEEVVTHRFYETENIRLHFCLQWWNGFHVCRKCALEAITHGKIRTGMSRMDGFETNYIGANGLMLKDNGKVKLFRWVKW